MKILISHNPSSTTLRYILSPIHLVNNYTSQSYRYCPSNIEVISWLGAYYMDSQYADKAIQFFERASLIQ